MSSRLTQTLRGLMRRPFVNDQTDHRLARRHLVVRDAAAMTLENLERRRLMSAGALDTAYGTGGIARSDFTGPANDVATKLVNISGRLLAIGRADSQTLLKMYNTDGSLASSFGTGGKVLFRAAQLGSTTGSAGLNAAAVQADGKIVLAGTVDGHLAVVRLTALGALDTSFDGDGIAVLSEPGTSGGVIAVTTDQHVIVAGIKDTGDGNDDVVVAQFNTNGSADSGFNGSGYRVDDWTVPGFDNVGGIAADGNSVVVSGTENISPGVSKLIVAKYNNLGARDGGFGVSGLVVSQFGTAGGEVGVFGSHIVVVGTSGSQLILQALNDGNGTPFIGFGGTPSGATMNSFGFASAQGSQLAPDGAGGFLVSGLSNLNTLNPIQFFIAHFDGAGTWDSGFNSGAGATVVTPGQDYTMAAVNTNAFALGDNGDASPPDTDLLLTRLVSTGAQDSAFGTGGFVQSNTIVSEPDAGVAMATQADGKIVMVGTSQQANTTLTVITRYNTNGSADTSFGTGGRVSFDWNGASPTGVAVTSDGHIFVTSQSDLNVYSAGGTLLSTTPAPGGMTISALAASGDTVYVAGLVPGPNSSLEFGLTKWSSTGVQDGAFGTAVSAFAPPAGNTFAQPSAVAVLTDGRITVAGTFFSGSGTDFAAARFLTDGTLDASFDSDGMTTAGLSAAQAFGAAVDGPGALLIAGSVNGQAVVARFTPAGQLDPAFGTAGIATIATADPAEAHGVAFAASGKIVVAGTVTEASGGSHILVARLLAGGGLDNSFDGDGIASGLTGITNSLAAGVAIDSNQKILIGGTGDDDVIVARYDAGVVITPPPPPPGASLQSDPLHPGQTVLVVNGTTGNDTITFTAAGSGVTVSLNGTNLGTFAPTGGRIVVSGGDGNDNIQVSNNVSLNVDLIGGAGNDTLGGGSGSDIIIGGDGADVITGGNGRDILIGGAGGDVIDGNTADDILVAGTTAFDNNTASLHLISAEWNSARSYDQRVANIHNDSNATFGSRLNGGVFLSVETGNVTVFDDGAVDTLTGNQGTDWFLFNNDSGVQDVITDAKKQETTTDI